MSPALITTCWLCPAPAIFVTVSQNKSFAQIQFCASLKPPLALMILSFSFLSASVNTIQLQPPHQGRCSGPCSCVLTRVQSKMLFTFSRPHPHPPPHPPPCLPFLFLVGSQTECIRAGRLNCKQSLRCRCRLWVTFRCKQTVQTFFSPLPLNGNFDWPSN